MYPHETQKKKHQSWTSQHVAWTSWLRSMGPGLLLTAWVIFLRCCHFETWSWFILEEIWAAFFFLFITSGLDLDTPVWRWHHVKTLQSLYHVSWYGGKVSHVKATVYGFISVSLAVDKHGQGWYLHMAFSTLFALSLSLPLCAWVSLPLPLPSIFLGVAWLHYKYYNKLLGEPLHSSQITTKPQLLPLYVLVSPIKVIPTRTSLLPLLSRVLFEAARVLERKTDKLLWRMKKVDFISAAGCSLRRVGLLQKLLFFPPS